MKLYIFGIQRSRTTLLASLLGGHSQINMLNQSTTEDQNRLVGKKYQGNKLIVNHDICWSRKSSRIRELLYHKTYKILKKIKNYHALRPSARYNIQELLKEDCKIIIILRPKNEVLDSILRRTTMTRKEAEKEYVNGDEVLKKIIKKRDCLIINSDKLINETENTLKVACEYLNISYERNMFDGVKYMYSSVYKETKIVQNNENRFIKSK